MNLYLRKVVHPQAHENYRVILKLNGDEFEIGSIGIQDGAAWAWGIDTVIPMRALETQGEGSDRRDCMRQFKAAWERFAADEANLTEFLKMKRRRRWWKSLPPAAVISVALSCRMENKCGSDPQLGETSSPALWR
jgi:hypothetical protein